MMRIHTQVGPQAFGRPLACRDYIIAVSSAGLRDFLPDPVSAGCLLVL